MVTLHQDIPKTISADNTRRATRLAHIVQAVNQRHFMTLREIAETFGVNMQTARRDVAYLDQQKHLRKTHGGAVAQEEPDALSIQARLNLHETDKQRIAQAAAAYVEDEDIIYLDGASTTAYIAPHLLNKRLHVVTNFLPLSATLQSGWPDVEVILTGGYYYPRSGILLGPPAVQTIQHMSINKVFMGAAGVTRDGIYNANMLVVALEQAVIAHAASVYLLVDSSKFDNASLMHICGLERIHTIITNAQPPDDICIAAADAGCKIHICA